MLRRNLVFESMLVIVTFFRSSNGMVNETDHGTLTRGQRKKIKNYKYSSF